MLYINKEWFESVYGCLSEKYRFAFMEVDKIMYSDILSLFDNIEISPLDFENESKMIYY